MPTRSTSPEAVRERLAQGMRARRRALKLSQEELAARARVGTRTVQRLEACELNATLDVVTRIAGALEVTPAELFARR